MNRGKKTPQSFLTCSKENDGKRAVQSAVKTVLMKLGLTYWSISLADDPFEKLISKMIEIR